MSTNIYDIFRQFLYENDCEEQFDKAFYEQCGANVLDENLSDILVIDETFLNRCFDWTKTIEGRDFWKTIDELWWKMYLQIAKAMKNHPKIDSILKKIDKGMSDEDKRKILAQSKSDFTIGQHWGLGAWVRDNYSDNEQLRKEIAATQGYLTWQTIHRDNVSEIILEMYYDYLKKATIDNA